MLPPSAYMAYMHIHFAPYSLYYTQLPPRMFNQIPPTRHANSVRGERASRFFERACNGKFLAASSVLFLFCATSGTRYTVNFLRRLEFGYYLFRRREKRSEIDLHYFSRVRCARHKGNRICSALQNVSNKWI
jgi:hypothetical protein